MSGEVVLMTLLGGMGTLCGPFVGAIVVVSMQNYLAQIWRMDGRYPGHLRRPRASLPPRHHRRDKQVDRLVAVD